MADLSKEGEEADAVEVDGEGVWSDIDEKCWNEGLRSCCVRRE